MYVGNIRPAVDCTYDLTLRRNLQASIYRHKSSTKFVVRRTPRINTAPLNLAEELVTTCSLVQYCRFPKNQGAQYKGHVVATLQNENQLHCPASYAQGFEGIVISFLVLSRFDRRITPYLGDPRKDVYAMVKVLLHLLSPIDIIEKHI